MIPDEQLHDAIEIVSKPLLDMQEMRIQLGNRFSAAEREGGMEFWANNDNFPGIAAVEGMNAIEKQLDKELTTLLKQHFMEDWIRTECKGVGLPVVGRLLGIVGPLDNFPTVSKLWKYCGLAVDENGLPYRRQKGQKMIHTNPETGVIGNSYSPMARVICHRIGDTIVKTGKGGPYRDAYDASRAKYLARPRFGVSGCPMGREHRNKDKKILQCIKQDDEGNITSAHIHAAAMRYAVKCFLKDFWIEWHRRRSVLILAPEANMTAA